MTAPTITVTVPATTANLGCAFDCAAIAVSLHLRVGAAPLGSKGADFAVSYRGPNSESIPLDSSNLIVKSMQHYAARAGQATPRRRARHRKRNPARRRPGLERRRHRRRHHPGRRALRSKTQPRRNPAPSPGNRNPSRQPGRRRTRRHGRFGVSRISAKSSSSRPTSRRSSISSASSPTSRCPQKKPAASSPRNTRART